MELIGTRRSTVFYLPVWFKTSFLEEEVSSTEPSLSVSAPCFNTKCQNIECVNENG